MSSAPFHNSVASRFWPDIPNLRIRLPVIGFLLTNGINFIIIYFLQEKQKVPAISRARTMFAILVSHQRSKMRLEWDPLEWLPKQIHRPAQRITPVLQIAFAAVPHMFLEFIQLGFIRMLHDITLSGNHL